MSKPNSQTTTHTREQRLPPSAEVLRKMAQTPCIKGNDCDHFQRGKCRYLHEPRKVQHDALSHKQLPARETEEEVLERVLRLQGFSKSSAKYIRETMSLAFLISLLEMISSFQQMTVSSSAITGSAIVDVLNVFLRTCQQFPDKLGKLKEFLATNIQTFSSEQGMDDADLKASIEDFIKIFTVPDQVRAILKSHQEAKALRESKDPVERARADPNGRPEPVFLDHLANALGLYSNAGFKEALETHNALGSTSPYLNSTFLNFLLIHEAKKSAEKLLREKEQKEQEGRMVADARLELLRQCLTNDNPNMRLAFKLLESLPVFQSFVRNLATEQSNTLISVFSSFLSYLAVSLKPETMITRDLLSSSFKTFCDSRKVGDDAEDFKEAFFKLANTQMFKQLFDLFHFKTQAYHAPKSGKQPGSIDVGELMKFMLKEILPLYEDKVPSEERDNFRMELIKHLLPFALVVSLRPNHANMIAGRWKRGKKDSHGQYVNAYLEMQPTGSKKSILYWLMSFINQNKRIQKKKQVECDSFEQLSSKFTTRVEVEADNGTTETKTVFSPQLLFSALDDILLENFIGSKEFGLPIVSINEESLRGIFEKSDDSIVLHQSFPDVLLKAIYYALGCDERSPLTRQFSDVKALFSMDKDVLLQGVNLCTQFKSSEDKMSIVWMLISHLGFKDACSSLETPMLNLMTLLSENNSPDLLRKIYDVMSLATMIIDSTERNGKKNESYFMSIIDALVVVLLKEKFPNVKQSTIMDAVYDVKGVYAIPYGPLERFIQSLTDGDQRKFILSQFVREIVSAERKSLDDMKKIVTSISTGSNMANCLFCHVHMQDGSFHDLFKRLLPFLLREKSLRSLSQTSTEFEMEPVKCVSSTEFSTILSDKLKEGFETLLTTFLSSQSFKIQRDLNNRMEEIAKSQSLSSKLFSLRFTKHISAIINLLNSLFETLSLEYRLSNETLEKDFPSTLKLSPEEFARLVSLHVLKVLGIVEPVKPVEPDASLDKKPDSKSKKKSKKLSASASSAPIQDEVVAVDKQDEQKPSSLTNEEYIAQKSMFEMMHHLVFTAVSTIYRVKLTSEDVKEQKKKVDTFTVCSLKRPFSEANSLNDLFSLCLPCWKSKSVQELILPILDHFFKSGNDLVRQLYSQLQRYGFFFENAESSSYEDLFQFLANPDAVLSKKDDYETTDDDMLAELKQTIEFFNDTTEVDLSKPVIERKTPSLRKRVAPPVDSGMASGGGPAPEPVAESASEPEEVEVREKAPTGVDKQTLLDHLGNSKKDAIAYLESCDRDEIDDSVLDYLKSDDSQIEDAVNAINEQYD